MKPPTEAQRKEFWEWCGFKWRKSIGLRRVLDSRGLTPIMSQEGWYYQDKYYGCHELPPIDLNNLFKYAVPKLGCMDVISLEQGLWSIHFHDTAESEQYWVHQTRGCDNVALGLFWAIHSVLQEGK